MTLFLGQSFSDYRTLPAASTTVVDELLLTPAGLQAFLEGFYALGAPSINRQALRTEQYRQLIALHLELCRAGKFTNSFYNASFLADQTATAAALLSRRDELLEAGYRLREEAEATTPSRLAVLHQIESLLLDDTYDLPLMLGEADRLLLLLSALPEDRHPRLTIYLNEPRELLGTGTQRLLDALESLGDTVKVLPEPEVLTSGTDLAKWQSTLRAGNGITVAAPSPANDLKLRADGSLVLLRAHRETHIAAYLAKLLQKNPEWRPMTLLSVRNQTLENALLSEGLPSLGVPSTSLARPSLQVLKLITTFLWQPLEVDRVMEFVSLVTKPLHWRLAQRIAVYLADTPGLFGPRWFAMIEGFFKEMADERSWSTSRVNTVREQYESWFRRKRYDREGRVPKFDLRQLFSNLREWALEEYTDARAKTDAVEPSGLLVLAAQALRAMELLDAQPETELNYLEVERLVRTVYEPAPTQFQYEEEGALMAAFAPASVLRWPNSAPVEDLLWWDFIEHEPDYFFSRYYPDELAYLSERGIVVQGPDIQNALAAWRQLRPVLHPRQQLVLCLPERVDGAPVEPHPLLGDLEAAFPDGDLEAITVNIDSAGAVVPVLDGKAIPTFAPVPVAPLARPVPQLQLQRPEAISERATETPTALEDLLYYPHKWVFRHQLRLQGTPILSIAGENRLRGNLSHLFIERLLNRIKTDGKTYGKPDVTAWINDNWRRLLEHEGAVLLEYGQEPERVQFVRTMQYAAWSLVDYIQRNGWRIRGSEAVVDGELVPMGGQAVKGRADLVLEREQNGRSEVAIVDLKWRGKTTFRNLLRNAKDVQLCLYAEFVRQSEGSDTAVHTCYYVLRDALMLSRNELAFANIETVNAGEDAAVVQRGTLAKIRATYNWRWSQFRQGVVEVRCAETLGDLEDLYLELAHDSLLEPEDGDARFDDYRSLIGLVR